MQPQLRKDFSRKFLHIVNYAETEATEDPLINRMNDLKGQINEIKAKMDEQDKSITW